MHLITFLEEIMVADSHLYMAYGALLTFREQLIRE
jgi:hypothetical protein